MFKIITLAISLLVVSACVSTKSISSADISKLNNASIQASNYNYPDFLVVKGLTTGLLGPLAVPVYRTTGKELVRDNNIPNPTEAITEKVLAGLEKNFHVTTTKSSKIVSNTTTATSFSAAADIQDLLHSYSGTQYILDVNSDVIQIQYRLSGFYYDLLHIATIRLVNSSTGDILGVHQCKYNSKDATDKSYTYNDLTQNNAKLVKDLLDDSANKCVSEVMQKVFSR